MLTRDTSACAASRQAAGLGGYWLKFSCRVALTTGTDKNGATVVASSDGTPDHLSNYYPAQDGCHEAYTGAIQNPNLIAAQKHAVAFPQQPNPTQQPMMSAIVGMALDGVPIFANFAAPGDDIYQEAKTFDRCGAHPQMSGVYHYHSEPMSISYDDGAFIGVMRDGFPIYGRRDADGSTPSLDDHGGHEGTTVDSPTTPVYHYHLHLETSTNPKSKGQQQYFLTTGTYHGTPASCSGC